MVENKMKRRRRFFVSPFQGKKHPIAHNNPKAPISKQDSQGSNLSSNSGSNSENGSYYKTTSVSTRHINLQNQETQDKMLIDTEYVAGNPPASSLTRLILPLWAVSVQGLSSQSLRRQDMKVLKRLDVEVQQTLVKMINNITLFDIEAVNEYNQKKKKNLTKGKSLVGVETSPENRQNGGKHWRRNKFIKQLSKLSNRSSSFSDYDSEDNNKIPLLIRVNQKLEESGLKAILCKEEKKMIGANFYLYFLEVVSIKGDIPGSTQLPLKLKASEIERLKSARFNPNANAVIVS